jgi:hypothetical protein
LKDFSTSISTSCLLVCQYWGLNLGPCTCLAGALPLVLHPSPERLFSHYCASLYLTDAKTSCVEDIRKSCPRRPCLLEWCKHILRRGLLLLLVQEHIVPMGRRPEEAVTIGSFRDDHVVCLLQVPLCLPHLTTFPRCLMSQ